MPGLSNAVVGQATKQEQVKIALAQRIAREAGLRTDIRRAMYVSDKPRPSVMQVIHHNGEPDAVRYIAAWYGLLAKEPRLTVFHEEPQGKDLLHTLVTGLKPEQIQRLKLPNATVVGSMVHIFDPNGDNNSYITQLGKRINAEHSTITGTGHQLGSGKSSSTDARAAYRTVISDYEGAGSKQTR